ncbi:hypothetical protein PGTUg99_000952 [Puccinia graminis f. sp. tritici]|uniref:Uncharacterized protein n=1 Tax=Puccinia graminis f. sp. tritici TaxID=56615 RepID=A0A5B0RRS0_PUCGR|nr:hypothetical protein PGTUg99_000952 [Puccinia graminis f. sp. tritici]
MGAADRSAAPRRSPQPGGCRSICSPQTICSAWGLQIDLQPPDHILSLGAAERSAAPDHILSLGAAERSAAPDDLLSLGAADRSAAPRPYPQPGGCRAFCSPQTISWGCRSICSPQTICSAWGLQIDLQPPDHILSLGAADRSAAPRSSPQPGGCRSICSPYAPQPSHLRRVESRDSTEGKYMTYPASSRATRRRVSRRLVQPHGLYKSI